MIGEELLYCVFFFQAEDGIRDADVTGVQTCALPIYPVHCTGIVAAESFEEFELPREAVLNGLRRVRFVSPSGLCVDYDTRAPEAIVVDRGVFDRGLAARATAAGATLATGTRVTNLSTGAA